jgi:ribosome-binding factor A
MKIDETRKSGQLCDQVARSLDASLCSAGDPCLNDLSVLGVQPAPDSSHLRVLVVPVGADSEDEAEVLDALKRAGGWLRSRVAADIHRRRVPSLTWVWLPQGTELK